MYRLILIIFCVIFISCNSNPNSEVRVTTLDYSVLKTFLNDSLPSILVFDKKYISEFEKWTNILLINSVQKIPLTDPNQLIFPINLLKTDIQKIDVQEIPSQFNSPQIIGRFRVLKTDILKINGDEISNENISIFKSHIKDIINSYNALVNMMNIEVKKSNEININLD